MVKLEQGVLESIQTIRGEVELLQVAAEEGVAKLNHAKAQLNNAVAKALAATKIPLALAVACVECGEVRKRKFPKEDLGDCPCQQPPA